MRILLVITSLGVGGAEKVVVSLADALVGREHEVVIAYLKGDAILKPINSSIRLVRLGLESVKDLPQALLALRALLNDFKPDVVHSHLVHANILARMLKLVVHIPRLITTAHNRDEEGHLRMLAYRFTDRLVDLSTNVSDEAVTAYVKKKAVKSGRMITVHNGIAIAASAFSAEARVRVRSELLIDQSSQLLLAVGRLYEAKDYPNLFHALVQLKVTEVKYQLCIAGDGPLRLDLENLVKQLGLSDRVRFLGVRRDVPALMSAADIFVLSSAWEGFPMVIGEAMAAERIIVATDCGGVKEFVGNTGLLVPTRNAVALAHQLEKALAFTYEDRSRFGRAARERVKEIYSLDAVVDKWLTIYRNEHGHSNATKCLTGGGI